MGSPDPHGRQLNGLGSGLSSTSKVVILGPPSPGAGADVEFTFVQVGIKDGALDVAGNCGNMSSIAGPAAWDMGLVPRENACPLETDGEGRSWATVRIFNTNTNKTIMSRFRVQGDPPIYCPEGDYEMDGVPGKQSSITLSFLNPEGSKTGKALPTGNPVDELRLPEGNSISASLVDVGNPGVFVSAQHLGLDDTITPQVVEANSALKSRLEQIRRAGASKMGLDPNTESIPKIAVLLPPTGSVDLRCAALSMGQAHKAVPLTLALCLGAAMRIPGTIAHGLTRKLEKDVLRIGHPSGTVDVGIKTSNETIEVAQLLRTARVLMKGLLYY
ncbi:3-methylitaconate isomerase [Escovopsis weberi]|uniref:3-methylitaconate isomerase n=1 Tax=Escovopsis weberi TaxID=150374 RepID=A0A0M8MT03_ESCWE|nr:3-methylitaconate isomerase [Escovopsis weberi]